MHSTFLILISFPMLYFKNIISTILFPKQESKMENLCIREGQNPVPSGHCSSLKFCISGDDHRTAILAYVLYLDFTTVLEDRRKQRQS